MSVKLHCATPDIDENIGYLARVSNPKAKLGDPVKKLIQYLIGHSHWSPLEMAFIVIDIETTRDIGRQLLRHRSFHFQEFSQRYAAVEQEKAELRNARVQDHENRQNSYVTDDPSIIAAWAWWQNRVWDLCYSAYTACLLMGIAKEQARALLPEGLTRTRMFMAGTVRDWYHYVSIRTGPETQLEHRQIAQQILTELKKVAPITFEGVGNEN